MLIGGVPCGLGNHRTTCKIPGRRKIPRRRNLVDHGCHCVHRRIDLAQDNCPMVAPGAEELVHLGPLGSRRAEIYRIHLRFNRTGKVGRRVIRLRES